jgi:hypothetical protein
VQGKTTLLNSNNYHNDGNGEAFLFCAIHIIYKLLVNTDTGEKSFITPKKVAEVVVYFSYWSMFVTLLYVVIRECKLITVNMGGIGRAPVVNLELLSDVFSFLFRKLGRFSFVSFFGLFKLSLVI